MASGGGPEVKTTVEQCVDKLSIKPANAEGINSEEILQHNEKLAKLCQILYGPNLPEPSTDLEGDKELFKQLIHLWFNDKSVIEEIYHLFKMSGLCFLHEIYFNLLSNLPSNSLLSNITNWLNNLFLSNEIYILKHIGKKNYKVKVFDASKYKTNQIDKCEQQTMAIKISFVFDYKIFNKNYGHANILFIKLGETNSDGKIPVESEWFEPHGSKYLNDENKSNIIKQVMEKLIVLLFSDEKYSIQPMVLPIYHCPDIRGLQELTYDSAFSGSCEIFSMLYAILKLLNPERSQSEISDDIYKILKKNNNPASIIKIIIDVLIGLLNITKQNDKYYIKSHDGKKRFLNLKLTSVNEMIAKINSGEPKLSITDESGNTYEGNYENGLIVKGTLTFSEKDTNYKEYTGEFNNLRQMNGEGQMIHKNGDVHKGDFKNGKITGKGKLTKENGDVYEGDFFDGKITGKGKLTKENGDVYEGDFFDGKITGKGKLTKENGDVYEGDFKNGKMHGKGILTQENGDVYEGDFEIGKKTGEGKLSWANGDVYEGDFFHGNITGEGKLKRANGYVYEGDFVNGEENGKEKLTRVDGSYEGDFKDGNMTSNRKIINYTLPESKQNESAGGKKTKKRKTKKRKNRKSKKTRNKLFQ